MRISDWSSDVCSSDLDVVRTGDLLTETGVQADAGLLWPEPPKPVFSLAIRPHNRQDEVKLTASIAKLCEEDPSLVLEHNGDTNEMLLRGQGEIHLKLAVERLKSRFNVERSAEHTYELQSLMR